MAKGILNTIYAIVCILALSLTGCIDPVGPTNLEPTISISDVYNISRTDAYLKFNIGKRGTSDLTYLKIRYRQADSNSEIIQNINLADTCIHLSKLTAGNRYLCILEGGTHTAHIESSQIEFSTLPNTTPAIRGTLLSHGPTSAVIEVEILDNGGDNVAVVGCDIEETSTGSKNRLETKYSDQTSPLSSRIYIKGLKPDTEYRITPFAANGMGEEITHPITLTTGNTFKISEPGEFAKIFDVNSPLTTTSLTINGALNGNDFAFLRHILGASQLGNVDAIKRPIEELDLTEVEIRDGGVSYNNERFTQKDIITTGLFGSCLTLRHIKLPASALRIEKDAFAQSENLETISISDATYLVVPSDNCSSLRSIEVSDANNWYMAIDGVLFDKNATKIVWLPNAKTSPLNLPSTMSGIAPYAFADSKLNRITLPESIKEIGSFAFANSAISEITIPDKVSNLPDGCFQNCKALRIIRLGKGVTYIGAYALDASNIADISIPNNYPPVIDTNAFGFNSNAISLRAILRVPVASIPLYQNHKIWGRFTNIVPL